MGSGRASQQRSTQTLRGGRPEAVPFVETWLDLMSEESQKHKHYTNVHMGNLKNDIGNRTSNPK